MKQSVQLIFDELLSRYPNLTVCKDEIQSAYSIMEDCYKGGGKVMICGNGGSSSDSGHIVGELMKGFLLRRPVCKKTKAALTALYGEEGTFLADNLQGALSAIDLTAQSAIQTAFANDVEPDMVFAQQVFGYACPGDVVIGLSTSGNSENVVNAAKIAKFKGAKVISMTGIGGGKLRALSDAAINVPEKETFKIQELHLPIYHALCAMVEAHFFG